MVLIGLVLSLNVDVASLRGLAPGELPEVDSRRDSSFALLIRGNWALLFVAANCEVRMVKSLDSTVLSQLFLLQSCSD